MSEQNATWTHNADAQVWVKEWLETISAHPEIPNDPSAMLGWFANAIMCGFDCGYDAAKKLAKEQILKFADDADTIW